MTLGAPAREFLDFVANSKKRGICPLKRDAERRRVGLTKQAECRGSQTQPPCTGGMIAISSPGFSL